MLALLMSEYGTIIMGFVGRARNGWDGTGGVFTSSEGGLWDPDFVGFGVVVAFGGAVETAGEAWLLKYIFSINLKILILFSYDWCLELQ